MNKHLKTFVSYLYLITCLLLHRKFGKDEDADIEVV